MGGQDTTTRAPWTTWRAREEALARGPVVVLYGGESNERDVSLVSGRAVLDALARPVGATAHLRPDAVPIEVDAGGRWVLDGRAGPPRDALAALPADAPFLLALHGGDGEDGTVQLLLEGAGRAYTGAGPACSRLCMDKARTRAALVAAGVPVAPGRAFGPDAWRARGTELLEGLAPPVFVKHARSGSSVLVFRCGDQAAARAAVEDVVATGGDVVVEAEVGGLEVTVGVVGDAPDATALPVAEIVPKDGRFFDYDEKYAADGAFERCPAELLGRARADEVRRVALDAWRALDGEAYARIDLIAPSDEAVPPVVLEANTLPGFTPRSLLPRAAAADGVDFRELCFELVARALARRDSP